jgi:mRNA interferase MazF
MVKSICLAEILFSNLSESKIRPILVLRENSYSDFIYLPLTTNLRVSGIIIDNSEIESGYLSKQSKIVIEKIGVINKNKIVKQIAIIRTDFFNDILENLIKFLKNEK